LKSRSNIVEPPDGIEEQCTIEAKTYVAYKLDINTIRRWLGHVSLSTTNIYAEIDLDEGEGAGQMRDRGRIKR
jgi:hypothetical protein